jgi:hypothetical protein
MMTHFLYDCVGAASERELNTTACAIGSTRRPGPAQSSAAHWVSACHRSSKDDNSIGAQSSSPTLAAGLVWRAWVAGVV